MPLRIEPEISGVAIVLRGNFNPSIFQPFWMAQQELITDEAAAAATISVIPGNQPVRGRVRVYLERPIRSISNL
jgi:hypothetical protein